MTDLTDRIKRASEQLKYITSIEDGTSDKDSDPNKILAHAFDNLDEVVIAGTDRDGNFWFSSSVADGGTVLWLIEHLKMQLMGIATSKDNIKEEDE